VPAQIPVEQRNGRGQSQVPRWLRIVVIGRNPRVTLARAVILAALCFVVFKLILLHIRVEGISMLPTYQDGSKHFVSRVSYLWHNPQHGDVVAIWFSRAEADTAARLFKTPHVMLLKRVIGLPGETVAFANGQVLINGKGLDEPYEKLPCDWNRPPEKLGPNEYFVVGDNRSMPQELHTLGKVERNRIVGKAIL